MSTSRSWAMITRALSCKVSLLSSVVPGGVVATACVVNDMFLDACEKGTRAEWTTEMEKYDLEERNLLGKELRGIPHWSDSPS